MTSYEREPFGSGADTLPSDGPDPRALSVLDETVHSTPWVGQRVRISVPSSIGWRIRGIAVSERREFRVVLDKVVYDFLSVPVNEPRPYIPLELRSEDAVTMQWTANSALMEMLNARAVSEGREGRTLILRALADYIGNSPDDPMKHMPAVPVETVTEEGPGQAAEVPDAGTEEPIPGEEVGPSDDADIPAEE